MPKVSVIIPTHNRAEFLRSAVMSVLNQTFQDFEIVIIDDASKDHTQEVIAHFNDVRIKAIHNQFSKGDAGARNIGIINSTGEYIALLDDDDEWLPEKLKIQTCLLDSSPPEVGGVCTYSFIIEKVSGRVSSVFNPATDDLVKENFIRTSSILLKKECFEHCGLFDESMPTSSDYDMWIRISKSFSFKFIKNALSKLANSRKGNWFSNFWVVFWANRITIRQSMGINAFYICFRYDPILPIEAKILF